uniref:Uncharacterized protein n=1 Tax=Caudovirales sp. ctkvU4 TaxID=2826783 RepID=A0A8S5QR33_9CAUD|nr:MAG TPA: hypothetical protein [Caudovirales sp. ctkvU4]
MAEVQGSSPCPSTRKNHPGNALNMRFRGFVMRLTSFFLLFILPVPHGLKNFV